jgi:hypothetical protein
MKKEIACIPIQKNLRKSAHTNTVPEKGHLGGKINKPKGQVTNQTQI